ncbi:MAG: hypothetical protein H0V44_13820, partial [Planctomycetes bacterium]|nr:hypothetical protein [Planctomycetota bacterium]
MTIGIGLLCDDGDLPSIRRRAATAWGRALVSSLRATCEKALQDDAKGLRLGPSHEGAGNPMGYDFNAAPAQAFLGMLEDSPRYLTGAKARVLALAGMPAWHWGQMLSCGTAATTVSLASIGAGARTMMPSAAA